MYTKEIVGSVRCVYETGYIERAPSILGCLIPTHPAALLHTKNPFTSSHHPMKFMQSNEI